MEEPELNGKADALAYYELRVLHSLSMLRVVECLEIDVESDQEGKVDDKLDQEEVVSVGVPLVVNDDLDSLLLKQREVVAILDHSGQLDLVLGLDLVEANVVKLHLMLLLQILLILVEFFVQFLLSLEQFFLGFAHVIDIELLIKVFIL